MAHSTLDQTPAEGDTWTALVARYRDTRAHSDPAFVVYGKAEERWHAACPPRPASPDVPDFTAETPVSVIAAWTTASRGAWKAYDAAVQAFEARTKELFAQIVETASDAAEQANDALTAAIEALGRFPVPTLQTLAEKVAILRREYESSFGSGEEPGWIADDIERLARSAGE